MTYRLKGFPKEKVGIAKANLSMRVKSGTNVSKAHRTCNIRTNECLDSSKQFHPVFLNLQIDYEIDTRDTLRLKDQTLERSVTIPLFFLILVWIT